MVYYSKKLNTTEQKYTIHDRKLMAIVHACSKWCCYLANRTTKVFTDHKPLKHFQSQPKLNSRQICWLESLADYRLEMHYRPGKHNTVPDVLLHLPLQQPPSSRVIPGLMEGVDNVNRLVDRALESARVTPLRARQSA